MFCEGCPLAIFSRIFLPDSNATVSSAANENARVDPHFTAAILRSANSRTAVCALESSSLRVGWLPLCWLRTLSVCSPVFARVTHRRHTHPPTSSRVHAHQDVRHHSLREPVRPRGEEALGARFHSRDEAEIQPCHAFARRVRCRQRRRRSRRRREARGRRDARVRRRRSPRGASSDTTASRSRRTAPMPSFPRLTMDDEECSNGITISILMPLRRLTPSPPWPPP